MIHFPLSDGRGHQQVAGIFPVQGDDRIPAEFPLVDYLPEKKGRFQSPPQPGPIIEPQG